MILHHASVKALRMPPTAVRTKAYSFCQGLQVLHDMDPASSFPITFQPHWSTFHPSNATIYPCLTAFVFAHPSTQDLHTTNCLFAVTHDSDKMSFSTAQAKAVPYPVTPKSVTLCLAFSFLTLPLHEILNCLLILYVDFAFPHENVNSLNSVF